MPKKEITKEQDDVTIQDLVQAINNLSKRLDNLAPLAKLAGHLNEFIDDPKNTKTPGIPICIQDVGEYVLGRTFDRAITITTENPIEVKTTKPIEVVTIGDDDFCEDDN